jgi:CHAT domain-containing protein
VPDGALHGVSFAALPDPAATCGFRPLIAAHELLYIPTASVLVTQQQARAAPLDAAAIFANPVFSATDARVRPQLAAVTPRPAQTANLERLRGLQFEALPNSRREALALAALFKPGAARLALDFQASRAAVLETELKRYPLLHFATHARPDSANPALSGIVLSQVNADGAQQDGFLLLQDIYNLDLQAELVTLSACQTARGQMLRGEGVIGLTRGFLHSGARRVLASLWSVPDSATPDLMGHFYRALLQQHLSPAAALRHAQTTMWRQQPQRSPYYWAAFTLHGSW